MRSILALATLALVGLVVEDKARQVAGDAKDAVDSAVVQTKAAKQAVTRKVDQHPLISIMVAGGLAYALATLIPSRS